MGEDGRATGQEVTKPREKLSVPIAAATPLVLTRHVVLLFAAACGLSVANIHYAHPLLDAMAHDFSMSHASIID